MALRIVSFIILLFSLLFLPFWVSCILAILGIIKFSLFVEAPILFLISDLLYGTKEASMYNIYFVSSTGILIVLVIAEILKKKLKFYKNK